MPRQSAEWGRDRLNRNFDRLKAGLESAGRTGRRYWERGFEILKAGVGSGALSAKTAFTTGSEWLNFGLATDYARAVDRWMGHLFASKATIYDQAMDRVYNTTHIGGGDHRLFDGGHDPLGAWQRISEANPDDTLLHEVGAYFVAMWKDMVTPNGLPLFTWDQDTFNTVSHAAQHVLGVSGAWVKDMATYTATEMIGAATGLLALILNWDKNDIDRFASLVGSFGISSMAGGNPILFVIALVCLARSYQQAKLKHQYGDLGIGIAKGGIGSAAFLGTAAVVGGPWWVVMVSGVICAALARKVFHHTAEAMRTTDWETIAAAALRFYRECRKAAKKGQTIAL